MIDPSHTQYLLQALALAKTRRGFCAPNPAVGAVVVKNDSVIATGAHWAAGHPHAEIEAFHHATESLAGATLYVTLEPCCYVGKTPPCTEAIIAKGISSVFYAYTDPNPHVEGHGSQLLNQAGISCEKIEIPDITDFYRSYTFWQKTGRPFVTIKLAQSSDGKIAGKGGERIYLTGDELNLYTHQQRKEADGLLTSANTVLSDDPHFTARIESKVYAKPLFLIDSHLEIPESAAIFKQNRSITLFYDEAQPFSKKIPSVLYVPLRYTQGLDLSAMLDVIGKQGIHDLWVEVGSTLFSKFIALGLTQRVLVYIAPKIVGEKGLAGLTDAMPLLHQKNKIRYQAYGNDVLYEVELCSQE